MRSILLSLLFLAVANCLSAQNFVLARYIVSTGTITDEGVTFAVSSDDAEQENDEIDALFDDDLDAGWEGAPEDQNILTCGLRFQNICLPRGARIDSAFIVIYSHEAKTAEDVARLTIFGEDADHAQTFTEDALIDARPRTSANVRWIVAEAWGLWTPHRTPDLKTIIQEVVDRDGWQMGNAIAFMLLGENQGPSELENAREFESFENIADPEDGGDGQNHPERVPQLLVYYTVSGGLLEVPIAVTDTITDEGVTFAVSSDDAEQENDEIDALFDDDLDAGWEGAPEDQNTLTCGLRFRNVCLPRGAVIDSAFIEVYSHEAKTAEDVARLTIVGNAVDDAETFTEDALIDARPQTSARVAWTVAEEWGLWTPHRTADISAIVQELVDRDGWQMGNAMAFIILGENQGPSEVENAREFESFENIADPEDGGDGQNHPERVPRLIVYYSSPNVSGVREVFAAGVSALKVFPNPVEEVANIAFEGEGAAQLWVYAHSGQLVRNLYVPAGQAQVQLNVAGLPAGVYYLQAIQNGKIYAQKLVVR